MKKLSLLMIVLCCAGLGVANAQYTDLFDFNTQSTGENPQGSLIISGNQLFGVAYLAGKAGGFGNGAIFSIHTDGSAFKELFVFNDTDGYEPQGKLVLLGNRLFGMASIGGAKTYGDIFSIDTTGHGFRDLHDFNFADGYNATGSLIFSGNRLFGMTYYGGANGEGCAFSIDTSGKEYKKLYDFGTNNNDGTDPHGGLVASGAKLYGMTYSGGAYQKGVVFSIDSTGSGYTNLHSFNDTLGESPWNSLIVSGNVLFGMTSAGGKSGDGIVFSIHADGSKFKDMLDFNSANPDANGFNPLGGLALSGTALYGTTSDGGTGYGNIFTIDTSGQNYTDLFDLTNNSGSGPEGDVTLSPGNKLYILTRNGGANLAGTIVGSFACNLSVGIQTSNVSCTGENNGALSLSVHGSTPPLTYHWSPGGETTAAISGLSAGNYTVTVTDGNGCNATVAAPISQPGPLTFAHDSVSATSACNGVAAIGVSGGIPPYTYLWAPGNQTTDTIKNQCAGNYTCVVTDHNGCSQSTTVTINLAEGINAVNNAPAINIYPNPGDGHFAINNIMRGQVVEVYDYTGQLLSHATADSDIQQVDISGKANGIYLVKIISTEGSIAGEGKVVKTE